MKFSIERDLFLEGLQTTGRVSSPRTNIPAFEGTLIEAGENSLKVACCDIDVAISTVLEADVSEKGSIVINTRMLLDIVKRLPSDIVTVKTDEKMMTVIKCGMSEFTLIGTPAEEFPEIPSVTGERQLSLEQKALKSMIRQTIYAVATSENKPIHTGCLFEAKGEEIKVVAVDGYRLAIRKERLPAAAEEAYSFVVPGKTLSEISHILEDSDERVVLELSKKHILFRIRNTTVVSRLLEGEFLNYENALPKDASFVMEAPVRPFIESVERASLLINERAKAPIRLYFNFDSVKMSCSTAIGRVQDEFPVKGEGTPLEMGFNNRYLLDALKACEQEKVKIELGTQLTPMVIRPASGDGFLFLVLPVRIKNEN